MVQHYRDVQKTIARERKKTGTGGFNNILLIMKTAESLYDAGFTKESERAYLTRLLKRRDFVYERLLESDLSPHKVNLLEKEMVALEWLLAQVVLSRMEIKTYESVIMQQTMKSEQELLEQLDTLQERMHTLQQQTKTESIKRQRGYVKGQVSVLKWILDGKKGNKLD